MQAPTLIIHGTEDEVIDFSAGLQLYERCPKPVDPLWVEGAGHNDIELYAVYLDRLKSFLEKDLANKWDRARCCGDNSLVLVTPLWLTCSLLLPWQRCTELVSGRALGDVTSRDAVWRHVTLCDVTSCAPFRLIRLKISDFQNWFYSDSSVLILKLIVCILYHSFVCTRGYLAR